MKDVRKIHKQGLPERAYAHHSWPPIADYNNTGIAGRCAE